MSRDAAAHALLLDCEQVYSASTVPDDLPSDQTVEAYSNEISQKKYVHMYFAKHVALWRRVRPHLDSTGALWSIGAGPMLDIFGWFWDVPASSEQKVVACDVLDWSPIRRLPSWQNLAATLAATHEYLAPVAVPDAADLPQCANVPAATLPPSDVDDGATVLFPFVLNHVLGRNAPGGDAARSALRSWAADIVARQGTIVIADLHVGKAPEFWKAVQQVLGLKNTRARNVNFADSIGDIARLYPHEGHRRGHRNVATATVLVVRQAGARFFFSE